jgi:hypothetical protein
MKDIDNRLAVALCSTEKRLLFFVQRFGYRSIFSEERFPGDAKSLSRVPAASIDRSGEKFLFSGIAFTVIRIDTRSQVLIPH